MIFSSNKLKKNSIFAPCDVDLFQTALLTTDISIFKSYSCFRVILGYPNFPFFGSSFKFLLPETKGCCQIQPLTFGKFKIFNKD